MTSEWKGLWGLVQEMGADESKGFDITLPPPRSVEYNEGLSKGVEIQLAQLDSPVNSGGLLSFNGSQVLVYIPDQGTSSHSVLSDPEKGKRYHVSHCSTLTSMQSQNRDHRYVATNDTSGIFELTGWGGTAKERGALTVCRNCLKHINYQDYLGRYRERTNIYRKFSLVEFFSTYSSLFKYPYKISKNGRQGREYAINEAAADWSVVSTPRTCNKCRVIMPGLVELANNSEKSGVDATYNLCADCNRREHWQGADPVLLEDMRQITKERRSQGLLSDVGTWEEAYDLADPAFHGLMKIYQRQSRAVPEIGYPLTDSNGVVLEAEIALAWEDTRFGVVASTDEQSLCKTSEWLVFTLAEALLESQQDN